MRSVLRVDAEAESAGPEGVRVTVPRLLRKDEPTSADAPAIDLAPRRPHTTPDRPRWRRAGRTPRRTGL
jgi:hypothetical protein